jgi:uncharacterized protein (TIGR02391 family)
MLSNLVRFEAIVRATAKLSLPKLEPSPSFVPAKEEPVHPFERRDIHPRLPKKVRELFDDGHFTEATYHAFKFLDKKVQSHSKTSDSGFSLMMEAFNSKSPRIKLNPLTTVSDQDEQEGYRFVFAGGVKAIRNPRAHEFNVVDDPDTCLSHLSFVSLLLRRLEQAGYKT